MANSTVSKSNGDEISGDEIMNIVNATNSKQDAEEGKGLSEVNFTSAKDSKLFGIAVSATANSTDASLRDRSTHTGTQTSSVISDFTEAVQDAVAALLGAGSNVTVSYNDTANTLTVSASGGSTDPEAVRDAIGVALVGVGNISIAVNDAGDTITISTTATQNDTDANLKARANHTGVQAISTITGLQAALDAKQTGISLTTTGTTGPATFNQSTGALNIPQYPGTGGGSTTLPFSVVTTFTSAAIQTAIDAVSSNGIIYLMPGMYTVSSTITFGGKTNVTIDGLGGATLSGTGNLIILNGNTTNCCFSGISFYCGATGGGGQGLVSSNEQGTHKNFLVDRCNFDSPTYRLNGFSVNTYSATADGGSGTGKLFDGLHFDKCNFGCNGGLGRMGLEVLNHNWSDGGTQVYLKNISITDCVFRDLGKVAETDGTTYNGMAASISGRCIDLRVSGCTVTDGKSYGLEIVGTDGAVVTNCTFDYINNFYIPVSLADGYGNGIDATRNITIDNCLMRSKTRPMNSRGTTNLNISNVTFIGTTNDNSNLSALYFQKCVGITIKGGSLTNGAYNPLRFDDCKEVVIDLPRITGTNTTQNYASISIYSGTGYTGAGSQDYRIGINGGIFKKNNGITTTAGSIYETQGTVTGVVAF
jgi:hypothetical protein